MLKEIHVKNFAIIDDAKIRFNGGLNILTGETGAGKTLIIEAINLLIGERADLSLIRDNTESLLVQGFFDFSGHDDIKNFLFEEKFLELQDTADDIAISRELNKNGKNRAFINGIYTQAGVLKTIGSMFIDIHGQHDHQYLLEAKTHLNILDRIGGKELLEAKNIYEEALQNYTKEKKELQDLIDLQTEKNKKLSELKYSLDEIEKLNLKENEEENLENEKSILKNSERIFNLSSDSLNLLNGSDESSLSLINSISILLKNLVELEKIDKNLSKYAEQVSDFSNVLSELSIYLNTYSLEYEYSPQKLEFIQERIFAINEIKKKYSMEIKDIVNYMDKLKNEIDRFELIDSTIESKTKLFNETKENLTEKARKLSNLRKKTASIFEKDIEKELTDLNFKSVNFISSLNYIEGNDANIEDKFVKFDKTGIDSCEFLISLNAGESPKNLSKIASGGEVSRVMLALKSIISRIDKINTLVFDEIDSGIGGEAATEVGKKLFKISLLKQVICITHLAQIASFADNHLYINKFVTGNRTKIEINSLPVDKRINEISRMLSGRRESEISLMHAGDLINQCSQIKKEIKEEV